MKWYDDCDKIGDGVSGCDGRGDGAGCEESGCG